MAKNRKRMDMPKTTIEKKVFEYTNLTLRLKIEIFLLKSGRYICHTTAENKSTLFKYSHQLQNYAPQGSQITSLLAGLTKIIKVYQNQR